MGLRRPLHRPGRIFLAVACLSLPTVALAEAAAGSAGGIDLQASCPLPSELSDIRGHVLLRLTANETGRITWVKALDSTLQPVEKHKKVMAALTDCLTKRSYSEAVFGGIWKVRTDFLLALHYFAPAPEGAPSVTISRGRSIPLEWLEEMRVEKVRVAEKLLAGSRLRQVDGAGWRLRTDVPVDVVREIESSLEFATAAFDIAFPGVPPVPESAPVTIFVFRDEDKLHQVAAFDNVEQVGGRLGGEYSPRDRMIYTYAGVETPPALFASTIAHEATHHFVAQRLYGGERQPPFWVTEGIASLIQCLEPASPADLDLSAFQRGKMFKGPWRWKAPAQAYLDAVEGALRKEAALPLRAILGRDWRMDIDLAYGASWLIVHYLVSGEEGKRRAAFKAWMQGPEGEGDGESLAAAVGVSLEELERAVQEHVKQLL